MNLVLKKKRVMRRGMSTPRSFKVRRYATCLVETIEYYAVLPGTKASGKCCVMELNEMFLNRIHNICSKQACVK